MGNDRHDNVAHRRTGFDAGSARRGAGRVVRSFSSDLILVAALAAASAGMAKAGGGPENVLLVANPTSHGSMTIANHYVELRRIPSGNVLYLAWDPAKDRTDVETFRQEILRPVIAAAAARQATGRIDYVVYSSDFPWAIETRADVRRVLAARKTEAVETSGEGGREADDAEPGDASKPDEWPKQLTQVGSLNGLTYLWQMVLLGEPRAYMGLGANFYVRRPRGERDEVSSIAFRSSHCFDAQGAIVDPSLVAEANRRANEALQRARSEGKPSAPIPIQLPGTSYMLSTVLGVTAGRGNTVDEIVAHLRRSAAADGTRPKGTIYYLKNDNVRSKTRHDAFAPAVEQLGKLGVAARVMAGVMPKDKDDVQGAMLGTATFHWPGCGSTIRPGAICEHLTSLGGVMSARAGQTPLSEFLRYGAAGSSGTVTEPYAIRAKFPEPFIHVHYARGCSLAEAFYQSVAGPYQLLIVGDPLCRPWAKIPTVEVEGVEPGATVKGTIELKPRAIHAPGAEIDHFEIYFDGIAVARCRAGETVAFDTSRLADGHHELRAVAVEAGPIETRGSCILPVATANHGRRIEMTVTPEGPVARDRPIVVDVKSPGSIGIGVMHHTRMLARVTGESGQVRIDPAQLGDGPVRLHAIGLGEGGTETNVAAAPLALVIEPPAP